MDVGIYQIRNNINSKIYIGSSANIQERFKEHVRKLKRNKHTNQHLQNSWNKYNPDNFEFEIIETCAPSNLILREQHYIDTTQCANRNLGYNIAKIANKPSLTDEVKEKISQTLMGNIPWNLGIPHSESAKSKMRKPKSIKPIKGPHSDNTKEKIRTGLLTWLKTHDHSFLGRKHTDATKAKISAARSTKENSIHLRALSQSQRKPISQFLNGKLIMSYESVGQAIKSTKIKNSSKCANGLQESAGGYTWVWGMFSDEFLI